MNLIARIHAALERRYGVRAARRVLSNPLDDLILAILSQKTGDTNSCRAFQTLRQVLPTWEQAHRAPESAVAEAIGSAGLAQYKAARIKAILRQIYRVQGHFDLTFLRDVSVEEATAFLGRLNGISSKTVARLLLVSLGKPVFPVDAHIRRVACRLGLVSLTLTPKKIQAALQSMVPLPLLFPMHVNLEQLGQKTCKMPTPLCDDCPLSKLCPSTR
ncbi:MAG: endonuclease III [candidate division NC10 bacterium]|nr:endonuclease III [candidate division NC10 bacterium]